MVFLFNTHTHLYSPEYCWEMYSKIYFGLQETLGDEYVVVLRTHYFIVNVLDLSAYQGFVFNASAYDDIAHLYLIADLMITDYSSVFFDYANLRRPILFFMYDIEKYRDALRGFYIDIEEELPGPILMTSDEVIASVIRQLLCLYTGNTVFQIRCPFKIWNNYTYLCHLLTPN